MSSHPDYNRFQKFKVLRHSDQIEKIVKGDIPNPIEWVIYPSNICGYRCGHCIMAEIQKDFKQMLPEKTMSKIPVDALRLGVKCVKFTGGGDPLLNPWTLETARKVKDMGILVGIDNQGYLLDDPTPFDFVRYSVDAATADTYQKIHRVPKGDGWERVNKNISNHAKLRSEGLKNELGLAFVITPINWHEIEQFCEWGQQFNPDFIQIRPAYLDPDYLDREYPGGGKAVKDEIIPKLIESSKRLEKQYKNVFFRIEKFDGFWTEKIYGKCRATPLMAVTSGDGRFIVCQDRGTSLRESYLRFGNYNEQKFEEIWGSPEHRKVIESIDLSNCPRCVLNGYNEIIEHGFINDSMKMSLL
jgi:MoaA/NifB/PqqE/SkfB family radical SAM enzyme